MENLFSLILYQLTQISDDTTTCTYVYINFIFMSVDVKKEISFYIYAHIVYLCQESLSSDIMEKSTLHRYLCVCIYLSGYPRSKNIF